MVARKPEPGANITLTIDPNLQYEAEKELDKAVDVERRQDRIDRGAESVHRRNPGDGELSDLRSERAARPGRAPKTRAAIWRSRTPFEPGSVFKVVTLSAALETTQSAAGHDDQLRQRQRSICTAASSTTQQLHGR